MLLLSYFVKTTFLKIVHHSTREIGGAGGKKHRFACIIIVIFPITSSNNHKHQDFAPISHYFKVMRPRRKMHILCGLCSRLQGPAKVGHQGFSEATILRKVVLYQRLRCFKSCFQVQRFLPKYLRSKFFESFCIVHCSYMRLWPMMNQNNSCSKCQKD